jgi:hypothetical protein
MTDISVTVVDGEAIAVAIEAPVEVSVVVNDGNVGRAAATAAEVAQIAAELAEANAQSSEDDAAISETNAAASAAAALISENNAQSSEDDAQISETNAAASAAAALISENNAASFESAAATSASGSATSAGQSAASAAAALVSEGAAATSETNAAASEVASAASAAAGLVSENAAAVSETNAAASAASVDVLEAPLTGSPYSRQSAGWVLAGDIKADGTVAMTGTLSAVDIDATGTVDVLQLEVGGAGDNSFRVEEFAGVNYSSLTRWSSTAGKCGYAFMDVATFTMGVDDGVSTDSFLQADHGGATRLYYDDAEKFTTKTAGGELTGDLTVTGNAYFLDNFLFIGDGATSGDRQMKYKNDAGGVNAYLASVSASYVLAQTDSAGAYEEAWIRCSRDGAVELYHNGTLKAKTIVNGLLVDGGVFSQSIVQVGDSSSTVGTQFEAQTDAGGTTFYQSDDGSAGIGQLSAAGTWEKSHMILARNGSKYFLHNNTIRLSTIASGAQVDGYLHIAADKNITNLLMTMYTGQVNAPVIVHDSVGSIMFDVEANGDCWNQNGGYYGISDENMKQDILDESYGLAEVNQLRPISYRMKPKYRGNEDERRTGFVAQELRTVIPEAIVFGKHEFEGVEESHYSINHMALIPTLVNAIKELSRHDKQQRDRIKVLEDEKVLQAARLDTLETQVAALIVAA